jgi:hypothetical protein
VKIKGKKKKMSAHTLEFLKKKNKNEIYKRIKLKRKLRKSSYAERIETD